MSGSGEFDGLLRERVDGRVQITFGAGGRLQLADVIIHHEVSEDARKRIDLWAG
jgi:hypothetical protein